MKVFADDRHVKCLPAGIDACQAEQPAEGKKIMTRLIDCLTTCVVNADHLLPRRYGGQNWTGVARSHRGIEWVAGAPRGDSAWVPQRRRLRRSVPARRWRVQTLIHRLLRSDLLGASGGAR